MSSTLTSPAVLDGYVTIKDVARELGSSYHVAYNLAASGKLGEPIVVGVTQFFPRATAEAAIRRRREERRNGRRVERAGE